MGRLNQTFGCKAKALDYQPTDLFVLELFIHKNEGSEFNGQQDERSAEGAGEEIIDDDLRQEKEHISNRKKLYRS